MHLLQKFVFIDVSGGVLSNFFQKHFQIKGHRFCFAEDLYSKARAIAMPLHHAKLVGMNENYYNTTHANVKTGTIVFQLVIGVAVTYTAFKLFQSMFSSSESEPNQSNDDVTKEDNFFKDNISVVKTDAELYEALSILELDLEESSVLGFDCEFVSSWHGRRKVAILQLCSHRGRCVIIQLLKLQHFSWWLRVILENHNIIKVGVAPYTDAKFLRDDYGLLVQGTLDLRFMAHEAGCPPSGLKKMTATYLGDHGFKFSRHSSDWGSEKLSYEQIQYAATDVQAAIELCKYFAERISPGSNPEYTIKCYCSKYINRNYSPQFATRNDKEF